MKPAVSAGKYAANLQPAESEEKHTARLQPAESAGKYATYGEREKEAEAKSRLTLVLHLIGGEGISLF